MISAGLLPAMPLSGQNNNQRVKNNKGPYGLFLCPLVYMYKNFIKNLFIGKCWYIAMSICIVLFFSSFFIPFLWHIAVIALISVALITIADLLLLFTTRKTIEAVRQVNDRLHLGEDNKVDISLTSSYYFTIRVAVIDEVPVQFQKRDFKICISLRAREKQNIQYGLVPLSRGVYEFGKIICFVQSPLGLIQRRVYTAGACNVKVYPSTSYLRQFQLSAPGSHSIMPGLRKVRRLGHSMEFEQIKDYVRGDDMRSINWKATAKRNSLMVNQYTDVRRQEVYCIVDKGRTMKMSFDGMTLLDYSINATLAFLGVTIFRHDRGGLITFSSKMGTVIPAEHNGKQLGKIQEALYSQDTDFSESNYEALASFVYNKLSHRSLLLLFTNFETLISMERQLPYLRKLASRHLLCVVLFRNTQLRQIHDTHPDSLEGIYIKTIADRFDFEKKQIAKELRRYGILSILTTPGALTPDVVNKYVEIKSRQMI